MRKVFKTVSWPVIILGLSSIIQTFRMNRIEDSLRETTMLLIESDSLGHEYVKYADSVIVETIFKRK